jgi:hypothetical protein
MSKASGASAFVTMSQGSGGALSSAADRIDATNVARRDVPLKILIQNDFIRARYGEIARNEYHAHTCDAFRRFPRDPMEQTRLPLVKSLTPTRLN